MPGNERWLSIADAAELCGVSVDSIKRDLRRGRYPRAQRDPSQANGAWAIPTGDLTEAGRYTGEQGQDPHQVVAQRREQRDVSLLSERLAAAQRRAERAEADLDRERERSEQLLAAILGRGVA